MGTSVSPGLSCILVVGTLVIRSFIGPVAAPAHKARLALLATLCDADAVVLHQ
jgi:hypothetical protein